MSDPPTKKGVADAGVFDGKTELFKAIESQSWVSASIRLKDAPYEAKQWVIRKGGLDGEVTWRRLPIHEACIRKAPESFVTSLLNAYPRGAREKDPNGRLPLHHACAYGASARVIQHLLVAYPESTDMQDSFRKTPSDCVIGSVNMEKSSIIELLVKKPSYYAARSAEMHTATAVAKEKMIMEQSIQRKHETELDSLRRSASLDRSRQAAFIADLQEQLRKTRDFSDDLSKQLLASETKRFQLETRVKDVERTLDSSRSSFELTERKLTEERLSAHSALERETMKMTALLDTSNSKVTSLEDKCKSLQEEILMSKSDFDAREKTLNEEKQILEEKLMAEKTALEQSLMEEKKNSAEQHARNLKTMEDNSNQILQKERDLRGNSEKQFEEEKAKLAAHVEDGKAAIAKLENEIADLQLEMEKVITERNAKESSLMVAKNAMEATLMDEKIALEEKVQEGLARVKELETDIEQMISESEESRSNFISKEETLLKEKALILEEAKVLTNRLETTSAKVVFLEKEVTELQEELQKRTKEFETTKKRLNDDLVESNEQLTRERESHKLSLADVSRLEKSVQDLEDQLSTAKQEYSQKEIDLISEKDTLVAKLKEERTVIEARMSVEKEEVKARILGEKEALESQLGEENKTLKDKMEMNVASNKVLENNTKILVSKLAQLQAEISETESAYGAKEQVLVEQINQLTKKISEETEEKKRIITEKDSMEGKLTDENKGLQKKYENSLQKIEDNESNTKKLNAMIEDLNDQLRDAKRDYEMKLEENAKLQERVEEGIKDLEEHERTSAKVMHLEDKLSEVLAEYEEKASKLSVEKREIELKLFQEKKDVETELTQEIGKLKHELGSMDVRLKDQIEKNKSNEKAFEASVKMLGEQLSELKDAKRIYEVNSEKLAEEKEKYETKLSDAEQKQTELMDELKSSVVNMRLLGDQLEEAATTNKTHEENEEQLMNQVKELTSKIVNAEQRESELIEQLNTSVVSGNSLEKSFELLERKFTELKGEMESSKVDFELKESLLTTEKEELVVRLHKAETAQAERDELRKNIDVLQSDMMKSKLEYEVQKSSFIADIEDLREKLQEYEGKASEASKLALEKARTADNEMTERAKLEEEKRILELRVDSLNDELTRAKFDYDVQNSAMLREKELRAKDVEDVSVKEKEKDELRKDMDALKAEYEAKLVVAESKFLSEKQQLEVDLRLATAKAQTLESKIADFVCSSDEREADFKSRELAFAEEKNTLMKEKENFEVLIKREKPDSSSSRSLHERSLVDLEGEKSSLARELEQAKNDAERKTRAVQDLTARLEQRNEEVKAIGIRYLSTQADLENSVEVLRAEKANLLDAVVQYKRNASDKEEANSTLVNSLDDIKSHVKAMKRDHDSKLRDVERKHEDMARSLARDRQLLLISKDDEIEGLRAEIVTLKNAVDFFQGERTKIQGALDTAQKTLEEREGTIAAVENRKTREHVELQKRISNLEEELEEKEKKLAAADASNQKQRDVYEATIQGLETNIAKTTSANLALELEVKNSLNELKTREKAVADLHLSLTEIQNKHEQTVSGYEDSLKESTDTQRKLEDDLKMSTMKLKDAHKALADADNATQTHHLEKQKIADEYKVALAQAAENQTKLEHTSRENASKAEIASRTIKDLESKNIEIANEKDRLKEEVEKTKGILQETRSTMKFVQEKFERVAGENLMKLEVANETIKKHEKGFTDAVSEKRKLEKEVQRSSRTLTETRETMKFVQKNFEQVARDNAFKLEMATKSIKEHEKKYAVVFEEKKKLEAQLKTTAKILSETKVEMEKAQDDLQKSVEENTSKLNAANDTIKVYEQNLAEVGDEKKKLEEEVQALSKTLEEAKDTMAFMKESFEKTEKDHISKLSDAATTIEKYQKSRDDIAAEKKRLENEIDDVSEKLKCANETIAESEKLFNKYVVEQETLSAENAAALKEASLTRENLETSLKEVNEKLDETKQAMIKAENESRKKLLDRATTIEALEDQIAASVTTRDSLEGQLEGLRRKLNETNKALVETKSISHQQSTAQAKTIDGLERACEEAAAVRIQLEKDLDEARLQMTTLQNELEALETAASDEQKAHSDVVANYDKALEDASSTRKKLESELRDAASLLEHAKDSVAVAEKTFRAKEASQNEKVAQYEKKLIAAAEACTALERECLDKVEKTNKAKAEVENILKEKEIAHEEAIASREAKHASSLQELGNELEIRKREAFDVGVLFEKHKVEKEGTVSELETRLGDAAKALQTCEEELGQKLKQATEATIVAESALDEMRAMHDGTVASFNAKLSEAENLRNTREVEFQEALNREKSVSLASKKTLEESKVEHEATVAKYEAKLEEAAASHKALEKDVKEGLKNLDEAFGAATRERTKLQSDVVELKSQLALVKASKEKVERMLQKEKTASENDRAKLEAAIKELEDVNRELKNNNEQLKWQIDVLKSSMDGMVSVQLQMLSAADKQESHLHAALQEQQTMLDVTKTQNEEIKGAVAYISSLRSEASSEK